MKVFLCTAVCALFAVPAAQVFAQLEAVPPGSAPADETPWMAQLERDRGADVRVFEGPSARTMAFISDEMGHERVVKGAPYCADALHESVQPLADGNRIVQRQVTRLCRDGEGRTRQEVDYDGRKRVYLRDPVAREAWLLDPERKTARFLAGTRARGPFVVPDASDGVAWREYGERMREWGRSLRDQFKADPATVPPAPPTPPVPPRPAAAAQPVVIVAGDPARRLAQGGEGIDAGTSQVQVFGVEGRHDGPLGAMPPPPDAPPMPPLLAHRLPGLLPRGPGVLSPMGSREIEGVRVDGERTTWTIEPGRLGNEKPIVITREVWTSPELLLTVQTREFDPRSGETTYRLSKLKRGEPDAALMKVPVDYDTSPGHGDRRPSPPPAASGRG
jgi:hypothetical protein